MVIELEFDSEALMIGALKPELGIPNREEDKRMIDIRIVRCVEN